MRAPKPRDGRRRLCYLKTRRRPSLGRPAPDPAINKHPDDTDSLSQGPTHIASPLPANAPLVPRRRDRASDRRREPCASRRRRRKNRLPLRASAKVRRHARAFDPGRKLFWPCRARMRSPIALARRDPKSRRAPADKENRDRYIGSRKTASCGPSPPIASRSCKKRAEGGDARAGADHDDRRIGILGQTEFRRTLDEHRERVARIRAQAEEMRGRAVSPAALALEPHDADGEMNLPWMNAKRGTD